MSVDVLAIGAHPDDVDLGVGGTLLKLADFGYTVAILDLTRGEAASRGSVDERMQEADASARILNVEDRYNAELPDGGLTNTTEQQQKLIPFIRALKPDIILTHRNQDRHPDHRAAYDLVRDANFFAGVASIVTEEELYRAPNLFYYNPYYDDGTDPSMIIDVSEYFQQKLEALQTFRSQLYNADYEAADTHVSSPEFWDAIEQRAAYWGSRINVEFGEPLYADAPLDLELPPGLEPIE